MRYGKRCNSVAKSADGFLKLNGQEKRLRNHMFRNLLQYFFLF